METKKYASLELKVGLTAAVALILLAIMIFSVEKIRFGRAGYPLDVSFNFVDGINPQADVVIGGGVKIGRVESITMVGERIRLRVLIQERFKIPTDAKFQILSKGLMGDKYLNIVPTTASREYLRPGAQVEGVEPANIDKAFNRLGQVADSVRVLLGDPQMKTSLTDLLKNLSSLSRRLDEVVAKNEGNINRSFRDFSASAADIRDFSQNLKSIGQGLESVLAQDNLEHLRTTLENLSKTSIQLQREVDQINQGKGTLGVLIQDEQLANDLKSLVEDVKAHPWKLLWKQ